MISNNFKQMSRLFSQNFVAFTEYLNFRWFKLGLCCTIYTRLDESLSICNYTRFNGPFDPFGLSSLYKPRSFTKCQAIYDSFCSSQNLLFCYQNCSDLLWQKKCSSDREKLLKFKAEGREFAKILRSLKQFIQAAVNGQNNFW